MATVSAPSRPWMAGAQSGRALTGKARYVAVAPATSKLRGCSCSISGSAERPVRHHAGSAFFFLSERHRDALAHLMYGIGQGGSGGFVQLTGEVDTGRPRCAGSRWSSCQRTCAWRWCSTKQMLLELLETVCEELHVEGASKRRSQNTQVDALNAYLLEAHAKWLGGADHRRGTGAVARRARTGALLTNLETNTQKLLQIVLLGQPAFARCWRGPALRQLAQRITARFPPDAAAAGRQQRVPAPSRRVAGGSSSPSRIPRCAACTRCRAACRARSTCSASARCWPATRTASRAWTRRWWTPRRRSAAARPTTARLAHPRLVPAARGRRRALARLRRTGAALGCR